MAVRILGATCSLGESVVDRLLSMDIDVIAKEKSHRERNQTLLEYSDVSLQETGSGFSISFDGSDADIVIGKDLIIHDILPTRDDRWLCPEIRNWIAGNKEDTEPRFWLSVIDAANAISHIAKAELKLDGIHMSGRREWSSIDSRAEFDMLWQRTKQGVTGEFTSETLFGHEIAGMVAKPITQVGAQRPDLEPLHEVLLQLTGDGWRPLVPFRTALMTLIAGLMDVD